MRTRYLLSKAEVEKREEIALGIKLVKSTCVPMHPEEIHEEDNARNRELDKDRGYHPDNV